MIYDRERTRGSAPWLVHYPDFVPPRLTYPPEPTWWLLDRAARQFPDRLACVYYDQRLTYRELFEHCRRGAAVLEKLGLTPGDRVGLMLPNCPEYLIALYAIWMAGGVPVSLNPMMVAEEVSALLEKTECRVVVTLDLLAPLVCEEEWQPDDVLLVSLKDRLPRWEQLGYSWVRMRRTGLRPVCRRSRVRSFIGEIVKTDSVFQASTPSCDLPAYILPTGGTTGKPKAVVLTHRNLMANAWQLSHWAGEREGTETVLAVLPFFHSYGLSTCVTGGVAMAASLVLHHRFRPSVVLQLMERGRPTIFYAVPSMLAVLNERLRRRPADLSSLEYCISGGAPLQASIGEEFAEHSGATVVEGFGLSEASPVTHVGPLDGTARPGTIGLPLPDTEARIVDAETGERTLAAGEVGELVIRGPQVMAGYFNDPEETARVLRDGWLFTGDLGKCDADGFFQIVDRKKDLIITSGMNVYPSDVEHVLRGFPGVADVAVVGVPDVRRGELVKAIVVAEKGSRLDRKALEQFARRRLSRYKRPRIVEVLSEDLPRNFLGKALRRELRERHAAGDLAGMEASSMME